MVWSIAAHSASCHDVDSHSGYDLVGHMYPNPVGVFLVCNLNEWTGCNSISELF